MKKYLFLILIIVCVAVMAACSGTPKASDAVKPVEAFYDAIVTQNRDRIGSITCAAWEKDALREVDSFMGVKSELKDFSCSVSEDNKNEAIVTCKGAIAASYGSEVTDFPLDGIPHKVIIEHGEWRICGH